MADRQGNSETISWEAVNQLGRRYGAPEIDYQRFKSRFEPTNQNDPVAQQDSDTLHALVTRYGADGITLNTDTKEKHQQQGGEGEGELSQMAKRATQKAMG